MGDGGGSGGGGGDGDQSAASGGGRCVGVAVIWSIRARQTARPTKRAHTSAHFFWGVSPPTGALHAQCRRAHAVTEPLGSRWGGADGQPAAAAAVQQEQELSGGVPFPRCSERLPRPAPAVPPPLGVAAQWNVAAASSGSTRRMPSTADPRVWLACLG